VIVAWLLLFAVAASAQTGLEYSAASPTAAQIDAYLARKKSALGGLGASFESYGREYNVDPRLVVAIAGAETTFGAHVCVPADAPDGAAGRGRDHV
jgi:membrane-bound lytic murein transglycosylase B